METLIRREIARFAAEAPRNRFPGTNERYFDEPVVGFAAADDQLFTAYKSIIGSFHLTPGEMIAASFPESPWQPATVICWVLPVSRLTRKSNGRETVYPSRQWAQTRNFGEQFNSALRRHLVEFIAGLGHQAAAPQLLPAWQELRDTPAGIASTWSERHAAYAAGLGTFSLNDALITPAGIAHRLGSVITSLSLSPSPLRYPDHRSNCLFFREGTCGRCIARCPVDAISKNGHDKNICREYVYGTVPAAVAERYGVTATGCGLCQIKVPCEEAIPPGKQPYPPMRLTD